MKDTNGLFQFFNEIGIVAQLAQTRFERVMPEGLTLAQFTVLNHFVRLGGEKAPAELARAFQVSKGTMTSTLQRLESKALITIAPDPADGRAKKVAISSKGRAVRDECLAALSPDLARIAPELSTLAIPDLTRELAKVRQVLDTNRG